VHLLQTRLLGVLDALPLEHVRLPATVVNAPCHVALFVVRACDVCGRDPNGINAACTQSGSCSQQSLHASTTLIYSFFFFFVVKNTREAVVSMRARCTCAVVFWLAIASSHSVQLSSVSFRQQAFVLSTLYTWLHIVLKIANVLIILSGCEEHAAPRTRVRSSSHPLSDDFWSSSFDA